MVRKASGSGFELLIGSKLHKKYQHIFSFANKVCVATSESEFKMCCNKRHKAEPDLNSMSNLAKFRPHISSYRTQYQKGSDSLYKMHTKNLETLRITSRFDTKLVDVTCLAIILTFPFLSFSANNLFIYQVFSNKAPHLIISLSSSKAVSFALLPTIRD